MLIFFFQFYRNKGSQRDDGAFIWDGIEVRTLRMMAEIFNITLVIQKADNSNRLLLLIFTMVIIIFIVQS